MPRFLFCSWCECRVHECLFICFNVLCIYVYPLLPAALCKVMTGETVDDMNPPKLYETGRPQGYVGCKAPMFSFTRLRLGERLTFF